VANIGEQWPTLMYTSTRVYLAIEIRFTDGMFPEFKLKSMAQVRAAFNTSITGDVSGIRDYGALSDKPECLEVISYYGVINHARYGPLRLYTDVYTVIRIKPE
jgi:hypothetical protein